MSYCFLMLGKLWKRICNSTSDGAAVTSTTTVDDGDNDELLLQTLKTHVCIIGGGPAAYTAAIYAGRAELKPILLEGFSVIDKTRGGQPTTTFVIENFPGFPDGVDGNELRDRFRKQSKRFGARIFRHMVTKVDFSSIPFKIFFGRWTVIADSVIVATGGIPKRLYFPGAGDGPGSFWPTTIKGSTFSHGSAEIFRNKPLAVIGGGDSAMEQAIFLSKYGSKVYIIHRRDKFSASKIMQKRAMSNPKMEAVWNSEVVEAYGDNKGDLAGLKVKNVVSGEVCDLNVSGCFFAIGKHPAIKFLNGQLELDSDGFIVTKPGSTMTSLRGVFAAGEVQDKKYRQSITAAGFGCMAALEAEHYLQEIGAQESNSD